MKRSVHSMQYTTFLTPTRSVVVELLVFTVCFLQKLMMDHFPSNMMPMVWILKLGCTAKDASTHQWMRLIYIASSIRPSPGFFLRYWRSQRSLTQSSLSGSLTLVVGNTSAVL